MSPTTRRELLSVGIVLIIVGLILEFALKSKGIGTFLIVPGALIDTPLLFVEFEEIAPRRNRNQNRKHARQH